MDHPTFVAYLVAAWLAFQTSAMIIANKWDTKQLYKQLHDPAKELIDLDCDLCEILVDAIQCWAKENRSESEIVSLATEVCIKLNVQDHLVCDGIVPEFKVSARCYAVQCCSTNSVWFLLL